MKYIVKTINLNKVFNGKEAVSNVNMRIKKGEIYGFLGPNGAGKTTLMKLIANLIKPTSGAIELFGEILTDTSYEVFKRMGIIIENPFFYKNLTARETLEIHCEYMGFYNKKAINQALSQVNLNNIEGKSVKDFSMGMKKRLAIARAIITKPEFLMLDEPITGLDPLGIKEMRGLLKMLSQEFEITILFSSHILSEIEQIANTIGVINNGRLIKEVAMEDLKHENTEYVEIKTKDIKKATVILDNQLKIYNFKLIGYETLRIYDTSKTQTELTKALLANNIEIESINKKRSSLEEYFLELINGGSIYE